MCSEDGSAPTGVMNSVKRLESKCVDYRFKANNTSFLFCFTLFIVACVGEEVLCSPTNQRQGARQGRCGVSRRLGTC